MKHRILLLTSFLFLLTIYIPSYSQNSSARLKYLTKNADAIITGKVIQKSSHWNENKSRILTTATVQVDEYLKGGAQSSRIEILYPGGEVDGVGELYTHLPTLDNDEEVLLFMRKNTSNAQFTIMEGELGKFTLHTDHRSGEKITQDNKKLSAYKKEIRKIIIQE